MIKNIVTECVIRSLKILPTQFRSKSILLLFGIFINSIFDLLGLAAVLPLLASILLNDFIKNNFYLSYFYSELGFTDEKWFIVFLCAIIISFISVKNIFGLWIQKQQMVFSWRAYENISSNILLSAYQKGYLYFSQENSNKLLNRIVGVPQRYSQLLLTQLFLFINELIVLMLIITAILFYNYKVLFILVGIITPVFYLFYKLSKKRVSYLNQRLNDLIPKTNKPIFEIVFGYADVVIGGVFNSFKEEYLKRVREGKKIRIKLGVLQQIPNRLVEISVIGAVMIMLLYGVFVLKNPEEIIEMFSVFGLAAYKSIPSINRLMLSLINIRGQAFNLDILERFLPYKKVAIQENKMNFKNSLEIKNLTFSFNKDDNYVLKNINLKIKKGESIGIVGKSGSGKTTLINIFLGFLNQYSGSLTIDDIEINESNLHIWQKKIGYVRQDVFIIDGSIIENIAFGIPKDQVDEQKLKETIERSQLTSVVSELSNGINTNIGERGAKISGGQRQRIGIARALYLGAEILFFDEATSALDSETENEITESIRSLHKNKLTMIIVAHRKSTLKYCDRIVALKSGEIEEII